MACSLGRQEGNDHSDIDQLMLNLQIQQLKEIDTNINLYTAIALFMHEIRVNQIKTQSAINSLQNHLPYPLIIWSGSHSPNL